VSATLLQFAIVNDSVAKVPGKLEKQRLLAEYFAGLNDERDVLLAVRYAGGRAFAQTDERVLGISGANISAVAMMLWKLDYPTYRNAAIQHGDLGEALAALAPSPGIPGEGRGEGSYSEPTADISPNQSPLPNLPLDYRERGLTLIALHHGFVDLAQTGEHEAKRAILTTLFAACTKPREIAYLVKIILSDLRTGVREGVLAAAVGQAFGKTLSQIQQAQFLIGDLEEVALLARNDRLADAKFTLFHPIQFMLATPKETAEDLVVAFEGNAFWAEDKLDGIRAHVHKDDSRLAIYSRTMDRIDESFPDVVADLSRLPGAFLLDGEIVAYRDGAPLPFAHLQKRLGRKGVEKRVLDQHPAAFVAFDLLYRDGELCIDQPLQIRKRGLSELTLASMKTGRPLHTSAFVEVTTADDINIAFAAARDRLNEGLVVKDRDSPYAPGRRGGLWFKLKTHLPTLDCVVTAAEYGHGKRRAVLSDYTFAVWDREPQDDSAKLLNIGKAYSGVTDEEIRRLTELFKSIAVSDNGRVFLVRPQVVLEIAMDQLQKSARHASGYSMRFPRIKRIRWDKRPEDADRISRVKEIYASRENITMKVERAVVEEPGLFDGVT